jgi:hypothetical protein
VLSVNKRWNVRSAHMPPQLSCAKDVGMGVQESFLGKLLLHITVFGVLLFRSSSDVSKYRNLLDEATFYDKQWNATWEGQVRPSEQEKSQ